MNREEMKPIVRVSIPKDAWCQVRNRRELVRVLADKAVRANAGQYGWEKESK